MTFETFNTYRHKEIGFGLTSCGEKVGYQVQNMSSLNTSIKLLNTKPDADVTVEPDLATLRDKVNTHFSPLAQAALNAKRNSLISAGRPDLAARCEITVLLTENGLQLAWSLAGDRKEIAPAPKKPLLRRILGPLYPGRKYWIMPATTAQEPGVTYTVRWPWIFWAIVALALGYLGWSLAAESFTPWSPEASVS